MNGLAVAALALVAFSVAPNGVGAAATQQRNAKPHKAINSSRPGSPGYTNSSPLGSAEKAEKKAKKKAAKH